ncbi:transcriptional regulator [Actinomycetospora sp. NBRC 106375]|uniref:helix-turn-helix transcriptional regulator n=1 Tax=Actinomycetospora sp. NBRC 106375 TaxID=3032207 RepID=UPI0024A05742|nr:WYL domain-containing protein [Actinomycetospora sp. NBRC 106375]GLZ48414.1 transcriptional regulator [Actinomycetospora sp. NBRC 106375]
MTRPTARVLALLEILQAGGVHPVGALAERLAVDERTVRRYVEHLQDLEVPVEGVRGRYGGYRLATGFRMPPLMLTDAEAVAIAVGLAAGRRTGMVTEAAESATAKVRRVVPRALGERLDALLGTLALTEPAREATSPGTAVLLAVAHAAREQRPLVIAYAGRGERTVHPYGVVAHSGRWYLTAADPAHGEVRTFRLDRIERATPGTGRFEVPAGFDPARRVLTGLAEVPWEHEVSVRLRTDAATVARRLPTGLAVVEELDGAVRVRLRAERLDWVPSVLASLDAPFEVESPPALRDHVRALARRLDAAAG